MRDRQLIRLLAIGVEKYQDNAQHSVFFAENDAVEFSQAWTSIYGDECEATIILSEDATRGRVLYELNTLAAKVGPSDTIVFYFAGHGFNTGAHNLLSLNDTFLTTLEDTAVRFEAVYGKLWDVRPQKLMLFLDACHSGFELTDARGVVGTFSADELRMIDRDSNVAVSFASCSLGEESFPYPQEKHGIWTFHLLRALRGDEPGLLQDGRILKAMRLQEHLAAEVPANLRNIRKGTAVQSPRLFGSLNRDFIVADLENLIAARAKVGDHFVSIADNIALVGLEADSIKRLSGFKKNHTVPENVNSATKAFVISIGSGDLKSLQNELYESIHSKMRVRYSDMKVDESEDGFTIICPAFDVQAELAQSSENPSEYEIRTSVDSFREPGILLTKEFADVFDRHLDQIEVSFNRREDLDQIVKRVESSGLARDFTYNRGHSIEFELDTLSATITRDALILEAESGGLADLLALASTAIASIAARSLVNSLPGPSPA